MTWLATQKILPSLMVGDPPDRIAVLSAQVKDQSAGWRVFWDNELIGWAWSRTDRLMGGATHVRGRIHFERLPIRQLVPDMLQSLLTPDNPLPVHVPLDADSTLLFDPSGRLLRLESTVAFDSEVPTVHVLGVVVGGKVVISVRSGGFTYETERSLPKDVMLGDALSPHTRLPGLWEGRKWTVELFSPLRPPTNPVEIVQAEVVGREPVVWAGHSESAWLVVFRGDPGADAGRAGKERARLWVRDDGLVIQQRVEAFKSAMTFVRMTLEERAEMEDWLESGDAPGSLSEAKWK